MAVDLVCVLVAYVLIWVPTVYVARARVAADERAPREQQARLEVEGRRAAAAQANTAEAFAPFAAAVAFTRITGADATWTAALCVGFVAARALYPFLYVYDRRALRTAAWAAGALATGGLFVLSVAR